MGFDAAAAQTTLPQPPRRYAVGKLGKVGDIRIPELTKRLSRAIIPLKKSSLRKFRRLEENSMLLVSKVEAAYRKRLYERSDDTGTAFYYSAEDFPGLEREPFPFASPMGHRMQGYFYHFEHFKPGRVVVFDHGMGGGHRSYLKEIALLAGHGYLVFAYDHTGCMESGGAGTNGFAQSLCDLDVCLNALKAHPMCTGCTFSVIGHSWGAYACLNIPAFHPEIRHAIAISGFVSVAQMLRQAFSGPLRFYRRAAFGWEKAANPDYAACSAADGLRNTDATVLVIHSADDTVVKANLHFRPLQAALADRENIRFLEVNGKEHNPNYTADAVRYKRMYLAQLSKRLKRGTLSSIEQRREFVAGFDWDRMTAQDDAVWQEIFAALAD